MIRESSTRGGLVLRWETARAVCHGVEAPAGVVREVNCDEEEMNFGLYHFLLHYHLIGHGVP